MKLFVNRILLFSLLLLPPVLQAQVVGTETAELPGQRKSSGINWSLRTEVSRGLAEYTDWDGAVSGQVGTKYKDFNLGAGLAYSYPFDDQVTVTEATRYGFSDLDFSATYKDLLSSPIRSLRPRATLTLPTSEVSQRSTMMTQATIGLSYSQEERFFTWGTTHDFVGGVYQYETADAFGSAYNSPAGLSNGLFISRSFRPISLSASYSVYTYYNFAGNFKNLQTLRTSVTWAIDREWSVSAYYRWRDHMVSYLSVFDDDTSKAGLYLNYSM